MKKIDINSVALNLFFLILIDMFWFQISIKKVYSPVLDKLNNNEPYIHYPTALMSWIFISILINMFANNSKDAFTLGFLAYGIYNFTNYATLKHYNYTYLIVDTIWGGIVSYLSYVATRKVLN